MREERKCPFVVRRDKNQDMKLMSYERLPYRSNLQRAVVVDIADVFRYDDKVEDVLEHHDTGAQNHDACDGRSSYRLQLFDPQMGHLTDRRRRRGLIRDLHSPTQPWGQSQELLATRAQGTQQTRQQAILLSVVRRAARYGREVVDGIWGCRRYHVLQHIDAIVDQQLDRYSKEACDAWYEREHGEE